MDQDIEQHIASLPQAIQDAIHSPKTSEFLQGLAKRYAFTFDKWDGLEAGVIMVLAGALPPENLPDHIKKVTGASSEITNSLVEDLNEGIFKPTLEALERELGNPDAHAERRSDIEQIADEVLKDAPKDFSQKNPEQTGLSSPVSEEHSVPGAAQEVTPNPTVLLTTPGTPTAPTPTPAAPEKKTAIINAPKIGESYKPGQGSLDRKQIGGDPYREPIE